MKIVFYRYEVHVDARRSFEGRGIAPLYDYQMLTLTLGSGPTRVPVVLEIVFDSPSWEAAQSLFFALFRKRELIHGY
jgi:hypothetical protein